MNYLYQNSRPVPSITEENIIDLVDLKDLHVLDFGKIAN